MKSMRKSLLICVFFWAIVACELVEDQTLLTDERRSLVNPPHEIEDALTQNQKHKILVAVIDSGVDYQHPELRKNVHLTLDEKGQPLRWGWDFTANDPWPSPLIGRTQDIDPRTENRDRWFAEHTMKMYEDGLRLVPELAPYLHPWRAHEAEQAAYHGTHVAGLMVYDRPDIGLLAYRVLPLNRDPLDGWTADFSKYHEQFVASLGKALRMAVADGAKVINLSLGLKPSDVCLKNGFSDPDCPLAQRELFQMFEKIVLESPDVVFVTAAGNSGESFLKDGFLPCGFQAKNVVCVGALKTKASLAEFSNLALQHKNFILAPGVEVMSTMPTSICRSQKFPGHSSVGSYHRMSEESRQALWQEVLGECRSQESFAPSSGTSMAAPMIARQLALLAMERPMSTGGQLVDLLFERSADVVIADQPLRRFEVETPSWVQRSGRDLYLPMSSRSPRKIPFYSKPKGSRDSDVLRNK